MLSLRYRDVSSKILAVAIADETSLQARRKMCPFQITFKKITISIAIKKETDADPSRALAINADRAVCMLAAVRAPLTLDTAASLGRRMRHGSTAHARQHRLTPQNKRTRQINSESSPQVHYKTHKSERLLVRILWPRLLTLGRGVWRRF